MVEYNDGSVLAQVSATDMRMPIQYALTWPDRLQAPVAKVSWAESRQWEFFPPDFNRFPLLRLAYEAQEAGDSATCTLNAADEIAVAAFLAREIGFPDIAGVVSETLSVFSPRSPRINQRYPGHRRGVASTCPPVRKGPLPGIGAETIRQGLSMISVLLSFFWLLVMLGVMILVHELGHFLAARLFDVRVDVFSIGFGPRLFGFRRGDTDYRFSAILFGGYVKMAGDQQSEAETDRAARIPE